tara:strand:- start:12 stop:1340 length:1329 start_codon:yes stop_codon:yes gene_type:complete
MNMKKISVIGGGPAGLAIAYYAKKNSFKYEVFEANNYFGGNCITYKYNDFYFDSGAHRLHDKDKETTLIFKKLLKKDLKLINVPSQIFRNNKFIDFPISPLNLIKYLGLFNTIIEVVKILFNYLIVKKNKNDFKSLVINRYGKKISELFILEYSEKLWGDRSENLSLSVAGKRLKGLNIFTLIIEIIFGKNKKTKHLDGSFYYPKFGIGSIFDNLTKEFDSSSLFKKSLVSKVYHKNKLINSLEIDKKIIKIDNLVSSMPLNKLISALEPLPPKRVLEISKKIKFRNVILVVFFLNKKKINNNGSMYFPSKKIPFTRLYEPRNRSEFMSPKNKTSIVAEIPCFKKDKYWKYENEKIINLIKKYLIEMGFFNNDEIIDTTVKKIFNAYPVLNKDYEKKIKIITNYLDQFKNLKLTGRNGLFSYSHIHDQMVSARQIINEIKNE